MKVTFLLNIFIVFFSLLCGFQIVYLFIYCAGESAETSCKGSDVRCLDDEDASWISWFCNQKGNEFFCEVDDDYILDDFNRSGLRNQVPFYDYALDLILDVESSNGKIFAYLQYEINNFLCNL